MSVSVATALILGDLEVITSESSDDDIDWDRVVWRGEDVLVVGGRRH